MAHLMGVRDGAALRHATDLGIAMQLTNICRDVVEDERRDRVYLPAELLGGDCRPHKPARARGGRRPLLADGRRSLPLRGPRPARRCRPRAPWAVRAARLIYAEIGAVIARRGFDV